MGPLHVEGFLRLPSAGAIRRRRRGAAGLADLDEAGRVGQTEANIELMQVEGDIRVVIRVDDGDRLARAVEPELIDTVRVPDLKGRVAGWGRGADRGRGPDGRRDRVPGRSAIEALG